ncbi:unnamed protein product [Moneuplotes crassus]|uniref:Uncharacterized protein n=1 Tax=Euplotes crassus TaxID=5936 RepID=A0AAD1XBK3_EUPCR|nr:unnamed protein product [Moneuplotes crassus]
MKHRYGKSWYSGPRDNSQYFSKKASNSFYSSKSFYVQKGASSGAYKQKHYHKSGSSSIKSVKELFDLLLKENSQDKLIHRSSSEKLSGKLDCFHSDREEALLEEHISEPISLSLFNDSDLESMSGHQKAPLNFTESFCSDAADATGEAESPSRPDEHGASVSDREECVMLTKTMSREVEYCESAEESEFKDQDSKDEVCILNAKLDKVMNKQRRKDSNNKENKIGKSNIINLINECSAEQEKSFDSATGYKTKNSLPLFDTFGCA